MTKILYMVVPCYNEELVLDETSERLKAKYEQLISNNIISPKVELSMLMMAQKIRLGKKFKKNIMKIRCLVGLISREIEDIKMLCSLV